MKSRLLQDDICAKSLYCVGAGGRFFCIEGILDCVGWQFGIWEKMWDDIVLYAISPAERGGADW